MNKKNTNNSYNELFKNNNLLSLFSNNSVFDIKHGYLFNSPLDMNSVIEYPYFSINKKKFDKSFNNYGNESIQLISGDLEDSFSFKMALFTLYSSIKGFKKKYSESKNNIEFILKTHNNEFNYNQYLMIKKLELAFSLKDGELDKFINNAKELNDQFNKEYKDKPLLINDFIKKEVIPKQEEDNNYTKQTSKIESSDKNIIINKLILNKNGDIASCIYNKIIDENESISSILTKRNKVLYGDKLLHLNKLLVNQSNVLLIKTLIKIHNEFETMHKVKNLTKEKINSIKSELLIGVISTIDNLIKNKVHLNFKSTINSINISMELKDNISKIIDSKVSGVQLLFDDYLESSNLSKEYNTPNYIAINMLTSNNSQNLKLISTIRNSNKLNIISKMYTQDFLSHNGKNTSAIELYLDMDTINSDYENSFSKSLGNGRLLVGQLYGIFNQTLNDRVINKLFNKIEKINMDNRYELQEIKYMFSAQNKNPYFMDLLIENIYSISSKNKKQTEFILETSLDTSIHESNINNINFMINYLKSDALTTNIVDKDFAIKMCKKITNQLNKREISKIDNIDSAILSIENINIIDKNKVKYNNKLKP